MASTTTMLLLKDSSDDTITTQVLTVGINARKMAEPLRALVPDLFEEIEKEEMLKSMSSVRQMLEDVPVEIPSDVKDSTVKDDDSTSDDVVLTSSVVETLTDDTVSTPPLANDTAESAVKTEGDGWGDFGFDDVKTE